MKNRETLFTFKLLSLWRDFSHKIQNDNFGFIEKNPWNFVYIFYLATYLVQNAFHLDEIFHKIVQFPILFLYVTKTTSSGNFR